MKLEYLYPELGNLYGDGANMRYLRKCLPQAEYVETHIGETPAFVTDPEVCFIYSGPMTERGQGIALEELRPFGETLAEKLNGGLHGLFTGNSMELLGKSITAGDTTLEGLGIVELHSRRDITHYDSAYIDTVITVFMILFGVNFNLYYLILLGKGLEALKSEELRWYLGVVFFSAITIALNLGRTFGGFLQNLRYSFFQVASIISTTGFGTADFNLWPTYSKWLLVLLMFFGACAGSTGGGLKCSRILILAKSIRLELRKQLRPHSVNIERLEGKPINDSTIHSTLVFFACYLFLFFLGTAIVSTDGFDLTTTFSSVVACLSNIGPGLELVGPMGSYIMFSPLSKIVLSLCMLLGRLEIFPILMLFSPRVWRK